MKTLIKNGRIVTAVDDYNADILIEDERVSVIGKDLQMEADQTIDASGKLVIPGGIDPHTHMELPFGGTFAKDTFETGTRAAAFGGTTTIVDFMYVHPRPGLTDAGSNRTTGMHVATSRDGRNHTPQGGSSAMKKLLSGLCALALAGGMTVACSRTDTERVGTVPDRTSPSASRTTRP